MGELHLEIITGRIKRDKGVEIITSEPIVVYRETAVQKAGPVEGKSPNSHNRFYVELEPLPDEIVNLIRNNEVSMNRPPSNGGMFLSAMAWRRTRPRV